MDAITLGHLAIDPEGRLTPMQADRPLEFTFDWRGRRCSVELSHEGLAVETDAARIPSTAEGRDQRQASFATFAALSPGLPEGWRMGLTPDHRIRFEADLALVPPTNSTELIAALVRFVLALDPYLDRLEAAGAGWATGNVKT
ncbi:MAG: hypothetical protein ING08_10275 [Roseomonas sp.]|nr:hypothetical protein [Roseomonas sp.]MCA3380621.1 hypothetical protein [Roseomonas sp.]